MPDSRATLAGHVAICRIDHWIKNVFVLPGVAVGVALGDGALHPRGLLLGLLAVCAVSSSNYVINEILDAPQDGEHPVKRHRPVPSGRVSVPLAYLQWIALGATGVVLGWWLAEVLGQSLLLLWIMGIVYNVPPLRSKELPWLDVISESVNNPIRLVAGWAIVDAAGWPATSLWVSYWLIGAFFMALKRFAELRDLGSRARSYRRSFAGYGEKSLLVGSLVYGFGGVLLFGVFAARAKSELLYALPLVVLFLGLYLRLAFRPESAVEAPEKLWREPGLVAAGVLTAAVLLGLLFHDHALTSGWFGEASS